MPISQQRNNCDKTHVVLSCCPTLGYGVRETIKKNRRENDSISRVYGALYIPIFLMRTSRLNDTLGLCDESDFCESDRYMSSMFAEFSSRSANTNGMDVQYCYLTLRCGVANRSRPARLRTTQRNVSADVPICLVFKSTIIITDKIKGRFKSIQRTEITVYQRDTVSV